MTVRDVGRPPPESPKGRHGAPSEEPGGHPWAHRRHERRRRRGRAPHPRLRRAIAPRLAREAAHQQRHSPAQDLRQDRPALHRRPDVPGRALRRGRRGGPRPLREDNCANPWDGVHRVLPGVAHLVRQGGAAREGRRRLDRGARASSRRRPRARRDRSEGAARRHRDERRVLAKGTGVYDDDAALVELTSTMRLSLGRICRDASRTDSCGSTTWRRTCVRCHGNAGDGVRAGAHGGRADRGGARE